MQNDVHVGPPAKLLNERFPKKQDALFCVPVTAGVQRPELVE